MYRPCSATIWCMDTAERIWKTILGFIGGAMLLLSLIDIPEKMHLWSKWIDQGFPHQHPIICRAILGTIGILMALAPWIREWCRPRISVTLTPTSGQRSRMELRVTNTGGSREFYADCETVALRNSPNSLEKVIYSLKWESSDTKRLLLKKGESANLLIANGKQNQQDAFAEMELVGLRGGKLDRYEWAGWHLSTKETPPEYDLKISIFGDGTKAPLARVFTLRSKTFHGPLEMFAVNKEAVS
jgi:hypothetical protein